MTSPTATAPDTNAIDIRFTCRHLDEDCLETTELYDLACQNGPRDLHLDLSPVESLSCCALTRLMVISRGLQAAGSKVCLLHVRPEIYKTLLANKVTELFDLTLASP